MKHGTHVLLGCVIFVVGSAVVAGLLVISSPAEERARRIDDRRVRDLADIDRAIDRYWSQNAALPKDLEELARHFGAGLSIRDPTSGSLYEYGIVQAPKYELCATFEGPSRPEPSRASDFWRHGGGRQCFPLVAQNLQP